MFTGLIQATGTVLALRPTAAGTRIVVAAPKLTGRWQIGDSIAVNGVCLTAVAMEEADGPQPGRFAADLADETIRRTTLTYLQPGSLVNLELPTPAGAPMGGHVVQGHVDGIATLLSVTPLHPENLAYTDWRLAVEVPAELASAIIPQGSITIDGISLTVAKLEGQRVEVAVIPHTYNVTNLRSLHSGAKVNIETDVLSKYASKRAASMMTAVVAQAESALAPSSQWLTTAYLLANGY